MNRRTLLTGGVVLVAGTAGAYAIGGGDGGGGGPDTAAAETAIREGINEIRYARSVPAVGSDDLLATVAREHSADMAARDFFAHRNPDGEDPTDRAGCQAGETLYRGDLGRIESGGETYDTREAAELAALVAESWRASRDHLPILIDGAFQNVGVGVHVADGEFFATAVFC